MKHPIYFPFYNISSSLVKCAFGVQDIRSVRMKFERAKIPIIRIGDMECVTCESLLAAIENRKPERHINYIPKSKGAKKLDDID